MRVITLRGESSVSAIADRAYSDLSPTLREKAVAALLRANPLLAALDRVRPGTVIRVPEVPGARTTPGRGQEDPATGISRVLSRALQDYGKRMAAHQDQFEAAVREQQTLLKDRLLRRAIQSSAPATELVKGTVESIKAEHKAAAESFERLEVAIEKLTSDLSGAGQ